MKLAIAFLFCALASTASAVEEIQIVRHGTNVTERPRASFVTNVTALLESCGAYQTDYAVRFYLWQNIEKSQSFVRVTFPTPRSWGDKLINQILVPLPEDDLPKYFLAKSGTNILDLSPHRPEALAAVGSEPALHLSWTKSYYLLIKTIGPKNRELPHGLPEEVYDALARLETLRAKYEAELSRLEPILQTLQKKASDDFALEVFLAGGSDLFLTSLVDRRAAAVRKRDAYKEGDPRTTRILAEQVDDLNKAIQNRTHGDWIELKIKVDNTKATLERLRLRQAQEL